MSTCVIVVSAQVVLTHHPAKARVCACVLPVWGPTVGGMCVSRAKQEKSVSFQAWEQKWFISGSSTLQTQSLNWTDGTYRCRFHIYRLCPLPCPWSSKPLNVHVVRMPHIARTHQIVCIYVRIIENQFSCLSSSLSSQSQSCHHFTFHSFCAICHLMVDKSMAYRRLSPEQKKTITNNGCCRTVWASPIPMPMPHQIPS